MLILEWFLKLAAVVGAYIGTYQFFLSHLKSYDGFRKESAPRLLSTGRGFSAGLEQVLMRADRVWGSPLSPRALGTSIFFALSYSVAAFVLCWLFGASGSIGKTILLPGWPLWGRVALVVIMIVHAAIIIWLLICAGKIDAFVTKQFKSLFQRFTSDPTLWSRRLLATLGCFVIVTVFVLPVVIGSTAAQLSLSMFLIAGVIAPFIATSMADIRSIKGLVPILLSMSLVASVPLILPLLDAELGMLIPVTTMFAFGGAFACGVRDIGDGKRNAVMVTGAVGGFFVGYLIMASGLGEATRDRATSPQTTSILLFLIILPIVNGFFDWISLALTRWLGHHLHTRLTDPSAGPTKIGLIGMHILADLIVAAVLLLTLTCALAFTIQLLNAAALQNGLPEPLNLQDLIARAGSEPLRADGLWVTTMLASTLAPTALYMMALLVLPSILTIRLWGSQPSQLCDALKATDPKTDSGPCRKAAQYLTIRLLGGVLLFIATSGLVFWVISAVSGFSLAEFLESVARFAMALVR